MGEDRDFLWAVKVWAVEEVGLILLLLKVC